MKPQFYNFIDLFKKNIIVNTISSDLVYWECDSEFKAQALQIMKDENFDLLGIKKKGRVIHKILTNKGQILDIESNEIIPERMPITEILDKFIDERKTYYFLNSNGEISKIVTIGDLQKGPCRLLLFGLIMNFEIVCIDFISKKVPNWQELLNKRILKNIRKRYKKMKAKDLDLDMLHCSFIDDKIEIIKKIEIFNDFCLACEKNESDLRYILKKLKKLRNNLAHSNHMRIDFKKWDEVLETIKLCKILTSEMRKLL